MKIYRRTKDRDGFTIDNMSIPNSEGNRHYQAMLAEVEDGVATILSYVKPIKTTEQVVEELESSITSRNLRGAALNDSYSIAKIQDVEDKIKALR